VFVDGVSGVPANSFASEDALCLLHWKHVPLTSDGAPEFVRKVRPTDIAARIPSKSRTPPQIRSAAFAALRAAHATNQPISAG